MKRLVAAFALLCGSAVGQALPPLMEQGNGTRDQPPPLQVTVCGNGGCIRRNAKPSEIWLFYDPVACSGAHCDPGTIDERGRVRQ